MASKLEVEVHLKSSAEQVWNSIGQFVTLYPKAFPDLYQSIDVLEGDGRSPGSVYLVKFAPGALMISNSTDRIEFVDVANKTLSYTVIGGDVLNYYKSFKATVSVSNNTKDEGSLVKLLNEFEKASEEAPGPELYRDFFTKSLQNLDVYLLNLKA